MLATKDTPEALIQPVMVTEAISELPAVPDNQVMPTEAIPALNILAMEAIPVIISRVIAGKVDH